MDSSTDAALTTDVVPATDETSATDETPTKGAAATSKADVRATRRAQREAERASRAQRKADTARQRAVDAARAGGLFEGMSPRTDTDAADGDATTDDVTTGDAATDEGAAGDRSASARPASTGTRTATGSAAATGPAREPLDPERRKKLTAALAVVSVVLLVVTGLATWGYIEARDATAAEQTVADAPHAATDAAREIVTQMFTYDHRTVDGDLAAVRERLTDPALTEFVEQSMPAVASAAKEQEAGVYATVAAAAPEEVVDAEHVKVLVMLNRMVSTKEAPEAASSASRLNLSMVKVDGAWKLGDLEAL